MKDTIHIPGIELGFKRPVLFERHAVGGEYGAGWKKAGASFKASARHESKAFARSRPMKDELFEKKSDLSFVSVSGAGLRVSLQNSFWILQVGKGRVLTTFFPESMDEAAKKFPRH